jgi:hypothetical protein
MSSFKRSEQPQEAPGGYPLLGTRNPEQSKVKPDKKIQESTKNHISHDEQNDLIRGSILGYQKILRFAHGIAKGAHRYKNTKNVAELAFAKHILSLEIYEDVIADLEVLNASLEKKQHGPVDGNKEVVNSMQTARDWVLLKLNTTAKEAIESAQQIVLATDHDKKNALDNYFIMNVE